VRPVYEDDDEEGISGVFTPPPEIVPAPAAPAQVIAGRYQIVERIGAGAMGQVLHVRHLRLGKSFALKLMTAEFSLEPAAREIFDREARLASGLSHPSIVSIVDFGEDPDWGLFIVMELVVGDSLADRIAAGPQPVPVVCNVISQLIDALHHSHAHDVVHADLKSENILCTRPTPGDQREWGIKLLDFGMAHLGSATGGQRERIGGTPAYIAPERVTGGPPSAAADLYAVGVIMYEMLAGSVPFDDAEPRRILERQLTDTPEPIAARRGEELPAALVAIVDRALAKDPAARYPDVVALGHDLHAFMESVGLRRRAVRRTGTEPGDSRTDAAAAAFDGLGVPAAGLRADGTIVVANDAFLRLLRRDNREQTEGDNVLDTPLAQVHSDLREDLRLVSMDGKVVRRRLRLRAAADREVVMRLLMTPSQGSGGDCLLVLHPLPVG
jgi:eukaryotic-like serine/threonine-protein kinase